MQIRHVFLLAALFLTATLVLYLLRLDHQSRPTRILLVKARNQSDAEIAALTGYLRAACPNAELVSREQLADYSVVAVWNGTGWTVILNRSHKGENVFFKGGVTDAIATFRQACAAMRSDEKEMADYEAQMMPMPTGRYLIHSADADHVFLVDTKTGAVWQLRDFGKLGEEFDRVPVEGLYDSNTLGVIP